MTAESILERINQKPFRPTALKTIGGTRIEIDKAEDIFIYDRMNTTCVVLFDPVGRKFVYEPQQIAAIEAREMERAWSCVSEKDLLWTKEEIIAMQEHQTKRTEFGQGRIDPREPEQQSIEMAIEKFGDWLVRFKSDDKEAIRKISGQR